MNSKTDSLLYITSLQQELEHMREFIKGIQNDVSGSPYFLNLFAPKGFGKSAYLDQIREEYQRMLPTSLVRVEDFSPNKGEYFDTSKLLVHVIRDIAQGLPSRIVPLPTGYKNWTSEEKLVELFHEVVNAAVDYEKVTLLLIDDYDSLNDKSRRWIQDSILIRASRTKRFATVLTSETEIRFTESFELRMRLESRNLHSLDTEGITKALPKFGDISREIYNVTGGLPLLTQEFINELEQSQVETSADFQAQAQELTGKYYRGYVTKSFLTKLDPDMETLLVLALLRWFDVKVMKWLLPELLSNVYQSYETENFLDLVERLKPWIEWRLQGGYTLNPGFRLMARGYVLAIKPELYEKVNIEAKSMYHQWLESDYDQGYLIELVYHFLALYRWRNGSDAIKVDIGQAEVAEVVAEYLESDKGLQLREKDLNALRSELQQDIDLRDQIPAKVYEMIQTLIDRRSKRK